MQDCREEQWQMAVIYGLSVQINRIDTKYSRNTVDRNEPEIYVHSRSSIPTISEQCMHICPSLLPHFAFCCLLFQYATSFWHTGALTHAGTIGHGPLHQPPCYLNPASPQKAHRKCFPRFFLDKRGEAQRTYGGGFLARSKTFNHI